MTPAARPVCVQKIGLKFVLYGADRARNWMYHWNSTPEKPSRLIANLIEAVKVTSFLPSARAGLKSYYVNNERLGLKWCKLKAVQEP
jgi:hypothetical protein